MNKFTGYVKAHKIISAIIAIVVIGGGFLIVRAATAGPATTQYVLGTVSRGTLISSVTGTGQVAAEDQVNLSPQGSSQTAETITEVDVKQGDTVKAGQQIAVVDNSSAAISLQQAKASLQSAQANYDNVLAGAAPTTLASSQLSLTDAEQNLQNKIQSDYITISNMVISDIDPLYSNPESFSPVFGISFLDSSTGAPVTITSYDESQNQELDVGRTDLATTLSNWNNLAQNSTSSPDVLSEAATVEGYLNSMSSYVNNLATVVDAMSLSQTKYESNIDSAKSEISSARSSVQSALTDMTSGVQSVNTAQASLNTTTAPPTAAQVASAESQLTSAQASLQSAENNYDNSFIKAPFDGVIAQVNVSVGDQANTSTVVATLITKEQIAQISLNEVDAANVKIGDPVTLTFSAIPDLTLTGTVAEIDTIGTVSQGVVSYNAKIGFDTQDPRVKPGMTVSASIITGTEQNVLLVPTSAIKTLGTNSYVQTLPGVTATSGTVTSTSALTNIPVVTGNSNDTQTEITSGLTEGQVIITRSITGSATTGSTAAAAGRGAGGAAIFGGTARTGAAFSGGGRGG